MVDEVAAFQNVLVDLDIECGNILPERIEIFLEAAQSFADSLIQEHLLNLEKLLMWCSLKI